MYFAKGFIIYSIYFIVCTFLLSVFYIYGFSSNSYLKEIGIMHGITKAVYVYLLGGESIVLVFLGYTFLIKKFKSFRLLGLKWNTFVYFLIVLIMFLLFFEYGFINRHPDIDILNIIHVNGWADVTAIVIGIIIYSLELRPIFK